MTHSHCWHASKTRQACTTREREQQGLHLVIGVLRQGHVFDLSTPVVLQRLGQCTVTRLTRRIFWAFSCGVGGVDPLHNQGHLHVFTQSHAMRFKTIRRDLQTVVHMHSMHLARPSSGAGNQ
jgi:hypothetical protein